MTTEFFKFGFNRQSVIAVSCSGIFLLVFFSILGTQEADFVLGLLFGLLSAMGLLNFFVYLYSQLYRFIIYSLLVLTWGLALAIFYGIDERFIWPDNLWLQQHGLNIFVNLSLFFSVIFSYFFLNFSFHNKVVSLIIKAVVSLLLLNFVIGFFLSQQQLLIDLTICLSVSTLLILSIGTWLWKKNIFMAKSYTLAWSVFLICAGLSTLDYLQIMSVPQYTLLLGAVIKTCWLTLTMVLGHYQHKQELLNKKIVSLENDSEFFQTEIESLNAKEQSTENLEYSMQERTLELEVALRELSEKNRELEEKNTLDALTGIRNRSFFDKKYQAEVRRSRREQTQLSIVMIDIDHFKKVNDNYGHLVGDECIKIVANTIQSSLKRPSDDVCRYGGEEFSLILPNTELSGAVALVEKIRVKIEETVIQLDKVSVKITVSAGIGSGIADLSQAEESILALADQQLYKAKHAGRNQVMASNTLEQVSQE
ncbi:diguanylate cyclase [Paraglaciecola sp. L3A3]|uniref:sensor domain-containing diguanylate cyclase n=1 Tax=Paraglaciecola sp. L3A3 TaxID=2686358 RepID=UPI00131DDB3B|nr:diguanylate cyclase [Paraglaciecola sp. L3A3]